MKQKIAIAGYGNLGKSLEKELKKCSDKELTAIYSRRNLDNPLYRPMSKIAEFRDADIFLIALGSFNDVERYAEAFSKFDTVDSFDVHAEIQTYKEIGRAHV